MNNILNVLGAFGWALIVTLCVQGVIVNIVALASVKLKFGEVHLDDVLWLKIAAVIYTFAVLCRLIYMVLYP